jgi:hypothetical protein
MAGFLELKLDIPKTNGLVIYLTGDEMAEIKGYRVLTDEEKQLMNTVKQKAVEVGELIDSLQTNESIDKSWLALGKQQLQVGFMSVNRSIAQPTTF